MIQSIRGATTTWVAKILFVLLIFAFGAWGIADYLRAPTGAPVLEIDGDAVPDEIVREAIDRTISGMRNQLQGDIPAPLAALAGREAVERLVAQKLLEREAARLGLTISEAQLRAGIMADRTFHGIAGFDRARFEMVLANARLSEASYVALLRQDKLREQLVGAVLAGTSGSEVAARALAAWREEKRVIETIRIPSASVPPPASPSDDELKAAHQAKAGRYTAPEYRTATFIHLDPAAYATEITITRAELEQAFAENRERLTVPERRGVLQAVFADAATAGAFAATARASGKSGRAALDAAAAATPGAAVVDLGTVTRAGLPPALAEAAFSAPVGAVVGPVATALGQHVLLVTAVTAGKVPTLAEFEVPLQADLRARKAADIVAGRSNELDDAHGAGLSLEEIATKLGLTIQKLPAVDANGAAMAAGTALPAVLGQPAFRQILFSTQPGEDSLLTALGDGGYVIARVDGVIPPALRPFETVAAQVKADLIADRRAAALEAYGDGLVQALQAGRSLADLATERKLTVKRSNPIGRADAPPEGIPDALLERLFEGKVGSAARQVDGDAVVVGRVEAIQPASAEAVAEAAKPLSRSLAESFSGDVIDLYTRALRSSADVSINESALRRLLPGGEG